MDYDNYYIIVGQDSNGVEHFIGSFDASNFLVAWFKTFLFKSRYIYRGRYARIYYKSYESDDL